MISFDEFLKQDEEDKYNMLQECNAIIQQKENIIKEVREYANTDKNCIPKHIKDYINNLLNILKGDDKE